MTCCPIGLTGRKCESVMEKMINRLLDTKEYGVKRVNPYEVFCPVDNAQGFYVSSIGRIGRVSDGGMDFIEPYPDGTGELIVDVQDGLFITTEKLAVIVAKAFLAPMGTGFFHVGHKDGDLNNNTVGNLFLANDEEWKRALQDENYRESLANRQELNSWHNFTPEKKRQLYYQMFNRCKNKPDYKDITICEEWENDIDSFYSWVTDSFYDFPMPLELDKDLMSIYTGKIEYSPENCCFIPRELNIQLRKCSLNTSTWYQKKIMIDGSIHYQVSLTFANPATTKTVDTIEEAKELYLRNRASVLTRLLTAYDVYMQMPLKVKNAIYDYAEAILEGRAIELI